MVEEDDTVSEVTPDLDRLFQGFLDILRLDPLSGNRDCGSMLSTLLWESGYQQIVLENTSIQAGEGKMQKKSDIFTTFFSYLPQDVQFLQEQEQHNERYAEWAAWLDKHFAALQNLILAKDTDVSIGVRMMTCFGERE